MKDKTSIYLSGYDDNLLPFIRQAASHHMQDIDIIDKKEHADLAISIPQSFLTPVRIGKILDHIEKILFENNYHTDVSYKNYHLNMKDGVLDIDGKSYPLGLREVDLCASLLKSGDRGCSRDDLLHKVWGYRADLETHALETQIYRLRQKIEKTPDEPKIIITIDGGYKFT